MKEKVTEKWDSTFWSMRETFYFACKGVLKNISKSAKKTKLSFWFLSFFKISTFSSSFHRKCGKNTQKWFCSHRCRWFLLVTRKPPRRFRETLVTRNRAASLWEFLNILVVAYKFCYFFDLFPEFLFLSPIRTHRKPGNGQMPSRKIHFNEALRCVCVWFGI